MDFIEGLRVALWANVELYSQLKLTMAKMKMSGVDGRIESNIDVDPSVGVKA